MACYCRGTAILTDAGEWPVESLAAGDVIVTQAGEHRPVLWIGRRSYGGRFLAGKRHLLPILLRAGSLGGGLPRRDLRVSPSHAMFLGGHLVAAALLVDGTTIVQEAGCTRVDYFHVELEHHSLLVAEGAPSESYLDDGNRLMFHNAHEWRGNTERQPAAYCAPRIESGFAMEAIRRAIRRAVAA